MAKNAPTTTLDKFLAECSALAEMTYPTGAVAAQEYLRLLKVTKQLRVQLKRAWDLFGFQEDPIRLPKAKTVEELQQLKKKR